MYDRSSSKKASSEYNAQNHNRQRLPTVTANTNNYMKQTGV